MNHNQYSPSKYRPDIDGLRAVAVLAVVLYHASKHLLKGGFVGVDIFFVISGYLITGILIKTFDRQRNGEQGISPLFGLISFYARRVRRIFPVLIVVLICCIIFGRIFLFPDEYELLGKHIAAGSVYISNLVLWQESGYFDVSSDLKPLLHLWSLGIEEQFYIFWPLIILLCIKLKSKLSVLIFILTMVSFLVNLVYVDVNPVTDFYSPMTRFWELAIGGLISSLQYHNSPVWIKIAKKIGNFLGRFGFLSLKNSDKISLCRNLLSFLGILTIIFSITVINTSLSFPGAWALFPTIGASLIIIAGSDAFINRRLLSIKPVVFIGLISYPLYLWHWPLLSFARIIYGDNPPQSLRISLVLAAIFLAWITYRFVEPPLRWGKHGRIKAVILLLCLLTLGGAGLLIQKNHGYHVDVTASEQNHINRMLELDRIVSDSGKRCVLQFPHWGLSDWTDESCAMQSDGSSIDIAVIGDSHAGHLFAGLVSPEVNRNRHKVAVFPASCNLPFIDLTSGPATGAWSYRQKSHLLHKEAYRFIIENKNISTVVMAHNPVCSYSSLYDNSDLTQTDKDTILRNGAKRTFDMLKQNNKRVVLVLNSPIFSVSPNACRVRPFNLDFKPASCVATRAELNSYTARIWYNSLVKDIVKDYDNIYIFDAMDSLCDDTGCPMVRDGRLMYKDIGHLNNEGSIAVGRDLIRFIDNIDKE